jgi:hypothetical protein
MMMVSFLAITLRKSSFDGDSLGAFDGFSSQMESSVIFRTVGGLRGVISVFD